MHSDFFVWCLLRQRNGGLNSGPKSANIVTDALHLMSTLFRLLLTTTLSLILSYGIWALHIKCLYLKVFTLTVCSTMVIFGPLLGKKVLFAIGTGSLKRTQIHYKKKPLVIRCSGCWELQSSKDSTSPMSKTCNIWTIGKCVSQSKTCPVIFVYGTTWKAHNWLGVFSFCKFLWNPSSVWIEVMEPIRNKCDHHWWHICPNNINVCCKTRVLHRYKISWEKGIDLTQSYDKSPYTNRNIKRAKWQHKQRHKKVRLHSDCGPTYDGQLE